MGTRIVHEFGQAKDIALTEVTKRGFTLAVAAAETGEAGTNQDQAIGVLVFFDDHGLL